jgi:hypothetical protein
MILRDETGYICVFSSGLAVILQKRDSLVAQKNRAEAKPEESWKAEDYFDNIVWPSYISAHAKFSKIEM